MAMALQYKAEPKWMAMAAHRAIAAGIPLITDRCAALAFLHGVDTSIREAFHLAYLLSSNARLT